MRVTDLSSYRFMGTYTVIAIELSGAVILDKPFSGREGDFLAVSGMKLEEGTESNGMAQAIGD